MAKVVKDRVVDDVDSGEMTSDGEAEIVVVGEMVTVCKRKKIFYEIWFDGKLLNVILPMWTVWVKFSLYCQT